MDPLEIVTDRCIRRGLGFAGLAVGMVMLSLSFDLALALRCGADMVALAAVAMLCGAGLLLYGIVAFLQSLVNERYGREPIR